MTIPQAIPFFSVTANFAAGTDTPREFLERCLARLESFESAVGAFICHDIAAARAGADHSAARWRDGQPLSPIDGMPFGIKDIIETADMPTEQGSPLFVGWRTGRDAASVAALREAGAVILGKVVTTEFAATEPRGTRNPWDRERTPGGSSSGSAAAVACGMVPAALGTQVVGSILRPASFCGCVGFKRASAGSIAAAGTTTSAQSCTGVLSASLEDAWLVAVNIAARAGGDPGYPGLQGPSAPPPPRRPRALAVLQTSGWDEAALEARAALQAAMARLDEAGIALADRHADPAIEAVEGSQCQSRREGAVDRSASRFLALARHARTAAIPSCAAKALANLTDVRNAAPPGMRPRDKGHSVAHCQRIKADPAAYAARRAKINARRGKTPPP